MLPWPPTANTSKTLARGRMISTNKLRDYHAEAVHAITRLHIPPMKPPYEVELEFQPPDKRRRDIANVEKAPVDSMTKAGLIEDDCKIDKMVLIRGPVYKDGRVIVTVKEMENVENGRT